MKENASTHRRLPRILCQVICCIGLTIAFSITGFSQEVRNQAFKADQALKSNARVNPSTLAMELSIPIGGYQGRSGTGLPIVFNYSSKVWQMKAVGSWESQHWSTVTDTFALYAKRSAAGWTSDLGVPTIENDFKMYRPFVEGSQFDGEVFIVPESIGPPPSPAPLYSIFYVKRLQVLMPDGSSHEFRKDDGIYPYGTNQNPGVPTDFVGTFLSVDGSRMRLELSTNMATLFLPNGSRYIFGQDMKGTTFIDRNGNSMSYDLTNKRWSDSMGRIIDDPMPRNWSDFEQSQRVRDKVAHFPSKGSSTFDVTFSWRYLKDPQGGESGLDDLSQPLHNYSSFGCQGNLLRPIPAPYLFNGNEGVARVCNPINFNGPNWSVVDPFNPVVLTRITLPNGQKYEFKYNVYGEIIKIIYPTGARERFDYGEIRPLQPQSDSYDQANRGVTDRWVSEKGDGSDEVHWTYEAAHPYQQPYTVTTTNPDQSKTVQYIYTESPDTPQPYGFGNAKTGRSYEDRVLSTTGALLKRHLTSFEVSGPTAGGYSAATRDMRPNKEVTITFEPNSAYALASMTETVYDTNSDPQYFAHLNPKQAKTYGYIVLSSTGAQTATIDQLSALFSASNLVKTEEIDYLYDANYKARNINGLPVETRIFDKNGVLKAKSQIGYDEAAYPILDPGMTTTNWENPNTAYRGNATTTRSWSDIAANQYVESHAQYDNFGNLRKAWDALGNVTTTDYLPAYFYAYPTSVTTAVPDPTGQHGSSTAFTTSTSYDFNTGLPTSVTDANGQVSTMEYNDLLLRPTKVTAPNGQQTITDYGMPDVNGDLSPAQRFVHVKTQIDTDKWSEDYSYFDGLGRAVRTQKIDAEGDVFSLTCYDSMGRVSRVTNPFRGYTTQNCSTANGAGGVNWTTNTFDNAGRPWKVTTPDGAVVLTTYGGAYSGTETGTTVTVTDQAGKVRRSVTNALGQLVRVDEPDASGQLGDAASPTQPTYYTYDTLNNLTTVNQGVQTRTFAYNSLSRLLSATNPESGTIQYQYDANGNLTQKTDARGIATAYTYDALNRVLTRTYTGETGYTTPAVSYFYDNLTNAKGKLTKVSSSVSTTEYTSFDILGRVTASKQTTDGGDPAGYSTGYTYNLSGGLIEEIYPSGRVVRNTLDANGDLQQVQSQRAAGTMHTYANAFTYTAAGAVSSMKLGNGKFESAQFNSRLQPVEIGLGNSATDTSLLKLNYSYGTTDNNGNVKSQTITVPTVGANNGFAAVQSYTYDELNRLKSAVENVTPTGGSSSQSWKQTFTFDRYGNRRFDTANTTTLAPGCAEAVCNPQVDPATNRLVGYVFDNSGNTKDDANGQTFTYDAENKQREVRDSQQNIIGQYAYDGDGKRVKKVVPSTGETTVFVYDASGKLVAEYSTIVTASQDSKVSYLTADHLGSPRINTDQYGAVIARHDYHPFGEEIFSAERTTTLGYAADTIRKQFTGYERDNETSLDFAQARMYANRLGRFSAPDSFFGSFEFADPQTFNRYIYVVNKPLSLVDPTGLFIWSTALGGKSTDDDIKDQIAKLKGAKGNEAKIAQLQNILSVRASIVSAMTTALEAAKSPLLSKSEQAKVKAAIKAYGKAGKDNGVIVGLSTDSNEGGSTRVEDKIVIVAFNSTQITAANVAHEGSHAKEGLAYVAKGTNVSVYASEKEAYLVGALTNVGQISESGGPRYAPTASNSTTTDIWSVGFLTKGTTIQQAKAKIAGNIDTHLANNQIKSNSAKGKALAFPGSKGGWK